MYAWRFYEEEESAAQPLKLVLQLVESIQKRNFSFYEDSIHEIKRNGRAGCDDCANLDPTLCNYAASGATVI